MNGSRVEIIRYLKGGEMILRLGVLYWMYRLITCLEM